MAAISSEGLLKYALAADIELLAAQKKLADTVANSPVWEGWEGSVLGFVGVQGADNKLSSFLCAFSGIALHQEGVSSIKKILEDNKIQGKPVTLINAVAVSSFVKKHTSSGSNIGCVEKKLISYATQNGLRFEHNTLAAFQVGKSSVGNDGSRYVVYVEPCLSCVQVIIKCSTFW
ncbi:hypothetical protein [Pseudomonas syringae group genomosp. 3]|uniref:hypothetical protein n=1 Tax=Pseudomonas syringae group genomosp. 3 TaxID=251701 RepID=UPI000F00DD3A|nr:hypothetical protein [Pseudomonas syringae group genomosp. 3]